MFRPASQKIPQTNSATPAFLSLARNQLEAVISYKWGVAIHVARAMSGGSEESLNTFKNVDCNLIHSSPWWNGGGENGSLLSLCFSGTVRLFENEKHFLINVHFCVL